MKAAVFCGAENETRTRDPDLGKVVLYQLSYFRSNYNELPVERDCKGTSFFEKCKIFLKFFRTFVC